MEINGKILILNQFFMSDIWNYFKQLFKKEAKSSPTAPFIHEIIQRNEEEIAAYQLWKRSLAKHRILDWLNMQYAAYLLQDTEPAATIDFLNTPSAKGFVLYFDDQLHNNTKDYIHLFDFLKERVLDIGYKSYVSDLRTYNRTQNNKTWVETIQRHYLKPRPKFVENQPLKQRYGNIKIELLFRNERIINLQFSATNYQDRKFEKAETFKDLMKILLM